MLATLAGASGVKDFGEAGKSGQHRNSHRDLKRKMKKNSPMPEPYHVEVPVTNPDTKVRMFVWLPILLLHEMAGWLIEANRISLGDICGPNLPIGSGTRTSFESWCATNHLDFDTAIPFGLHGDGVPFAKQQSVEVFSWNCIAAPAMERILFALVEKSWLCGCGCGGRCTMDPILEVFNYSLDALFQKCWPSRRHDGKDWTPFDKQHGRHQSARKKITYSGGLRQARGDWAWHKALYGFSGWASKHMCWMCKATQPDGDFLFTDFSANAKWRSTLHTISSFFKQLKTIGQIPSPIFRAPEFLWNMIMVDPLHALDLGVSQDTLGNVCFEFWYSPMSKTRDRDSKTQELWLLIKTYYKRATPPTRISALTEDMIKQKGKGPTFRGKAVETRHLVPFACEFAVEIAKAAGGTNAYYNQLANMMHLLLTLYMTFGQMP